MGAAHLEELFDARQAAPELFLRLDLAQEAPLVPAVEPGLERAQILLPVGPKKGLLMGSLEDGEPAQIPGSLTQGQSLALAGAIEVNEE